MSILDRLWMNLSMSISTLFLRNNNLWFTAILEIFGKTYLDLNAFFCKNAKTIYFTRMFLTKNTTTLPSLAKETTTIL